MGRSLVPADVGGGDVGAEGALKQEVRGASHLEIARTRKPSCCSVPGKDVMHERYFIYASMT
jgi:hypothetical protein